MDAGSFLKQGDALAWERAASSKASQVVSWKGLSIRFMQGKWSEKGYRWRCESGLAQYPVLSQHFFLSYTALVGRGVESVIGAMRGVAQR
eukprot:543522-Pelagomonas_calceolata.AAC.1